MKAGHSYFESLEAALLPRKPSQGARPRKFDGEKAAHLIALACSDPPEGYACWTLWLLAEKMVELQHFSSISHESIRQVLKKTSCVPGASSAGVSPPEASEAAAEVGETLPICS